MENREWMLPWMIVMAAQDGSGWPHGERGLRYDNPTYVNGGRRADPFGRYEPCLRTWKSAKADWGVREGKSRDGKSSEAPKRRRLLPYIP